MERILIKRTKRNLEGKQELSFFVIELDNYHICFSKFFEEKDKLKYNHFERVDIVDKQVDEMYNKWEYKHIYKK
jgi:hypothetical protein